MANILLGVGILLMFDCASLSVNGYMRDFPGPYCATRPGGCCDSRKDECAVPISSKKKSIDLNLFGSVIRHSNTDSG